MEIQHFLACGDYESLASDGPSRHVLRGVGSQIALPADVIYPVAVPRVCLFTRVVNAVGSHRFVIRVIWHSDYGTRESVARKSFSPREFSMLSRGTDVAFTLKNVPLMGTGMYEFRLTQVGSPEIILAREYLEVLEYDP